MRKNQHPAAIVPGDPTTPASAAPRKQHRLIKAGAILFTAGILISIISTSCGGGSASNSVATPAAVATSEAAGLPAPQAPPAKAKPAGPKMTAGQANALDAAQSYLDTSHFSRKGLIQQLSSSAGDGYSVGDATFAANHVKVNWNEQAAKAAKDYLAMSHFSHAGLVEQLSSSAGDGYTREQAEYGVKKAGL